MNAALLDIRFRGLPEEVALAVLDALEDCLFWSGAPSASDAWRIPWGRQP